MFQLKTKLQLATFFAFLFLFILFLPLIDQTTMTIFQMRDLYRAQALWRGAIFFFGPEANGGGNLPGSFFYLLLGIPLRIFGHWIAVWYSMLVLFCLAFAMLWHWSVKRFGALAGLTFLILPLTSYVFIRSLTSFLNPSFNWLPIAILTLLTIFSFSDATEKRRVRWWYIACLFCGFVLQIHFSAIYFIGGALLAMLFSKKLALPSPGWRGFATGLLLMLLPLLPFLLKLGLPMPESHGQSVDGFLLHFDAGLRRLRTGLAQWRWHSFHAFHQIFVIGAVVLFLLAWSRWQRKSMWRWPSGMQKAYIILPSFVFLCSLVSGGPFFIFSFGQFFHHTYVSVEILIFLSALLVASFSRPGLQVGFLWLLCLTLFAVNLYDISLGDALSLSPLRWLLLGLLAAGLFVLSHDSISKRVDKLNYGLLLGFTLLNALAYQEYYKNYLSIARVGFPVWKDVREVSHYISQESGLPFAQLRQRLVTIGTAGEFDYSVFFASTPKAPVNNEFRGGYFILASSGPTDLLQREDLSSELKAMIREGTIRLGEARRFGAMAVIPYHVMGQGFADYFGNIGVPYWDVGMKMVQPSAEYENDTSLKKVTLSTCGRDEPLCNVDFFISVSRGQLRIVVAAMGLSQPSEGIFQDWTQIIYKPFVEWTCGGSSKRVELVGSLGVWKDMPMGMSLLAPFERLIPLQCERPTAFKVGWKSGNGFRLLGDVNTPIFAQEKSVLWR